MKAAAVFMIVLGGCQAVVSFEQPRETGEQCDDGIDNDDNGAVDCVDGGCLGAANCLGCGDGTQGLYEECDDGNLDPNDGCNEGCTIEICGDGVTNPGEECDDGEDGNNTDGCVTGCKLAACGDGFQRIGVEACDDGNTALNDGCNAACVIERCGDGVTQTGPQVIGVEFLWLASSCTFPGDIEFRIDGDVAMSVPTGATCTCNPGNFESAGTEIPPLLNGAHEITVDYSGPDNFLAWAVVRFQDQTSTATEIVIYEGTPGAAAARATSMCTGGFDENVVAQSVTRPVPVREECDDGNTNPNDGCDNSCRMFNP